MTATAVLGTIAKYAPAAIDALGKAVPAVSSAVSGGASGASTGAVQASDQMLEQNTANAKIQANLTQMQKNENDLQAQRMRMYSSALEGRLGLTK